MEIKEKLRTLKKALQTMPLKPMALMEVCGTHTMSIAASGIRAYLPPHIRLISGPGCPVCVTSQSDIEKALMLARRENVLITTFGDMIRVPSMGDRLENYKNVEIVYSPIESLKIARENPQKEVVFIGVGFETTAPLIASTILEADNLGIENFSVLSLHKTVPEALKLILSAEDCMINGLILPGHVSAVTGSDYFSFLKEFDVASVVTGFEGLNILESIYTLAQLITENQWIIKNNYTSVVSNKGNSTALTTLYEVFTDSNATWRGIGDIADSGLMIRESYQTFNAESRFSLNPGDVPDPKGCKCGEILLGKAQPLQCSHFGKSCTPSEPIGPCMVSSEGTCAAWYKYGTGD